MFRAIPSDGRQSCKGRFADNPPSGEPIPGVVSAMAILQQ